LGDEADDNVEMVEDDVVEDVEDALEFPEF